MNVDKLLEAEIAHAKFGKGFIKEADEKYITVEFESGKISKFSYPGCFDKFLTLKDKRKNC